MSNLKKNIVLLFASILFAFLLGEIIVRLFVVQETKRLATYDKELGWRGRPNGNGVYIRKEDNINVPFHYNEYGFRDKDIVPRESVATRIVLLGDSFVENLETPFDLTFTHLLEQKLKRVDPRMDVVGVSSQGYSNAQEVLALRKFGEQLKPDIVLLVFFTGNDFEDNMRRNFAYLDSSGSLVFPANSDSWLKVQWTSFQRWLYESSGLVFYVKNVLVSRGAVNIEDASKSISEESKEYQYNITKKLILAAKEETEKRGARFGLLLITSWNQMKEHDSEKSDFVADVCRQGGIPVLESRVVVGADDFFAHDIHFNERGHRVIADAIYEFVKREFGFHRVVGMH